MIRLISRHTIVVGAPIYRDLMIGIFFIKFQIIECKLKRFIHANFSSIKVQILECKKCMRSGNCSSVKPKTLIVITMCTASFTVSSIQFILGKSSKNYQEKVRCNLQHFQLQFECPHLLLGRSI